MKTIRVRLVFKRDRIPNVLRHKLGILPATHRIILNHRESNRILPSALYQLKRH